MATLTIAAPLEGHNIKPLNWFQKLVQKYAFECKVNQTVSALNALSDHELEDIGINRYEIEEVARKATKQ